MAPVLITPTITADLDPEDGYLPREALCLVCNLTHNRHLGECPSCKESPA